MTALATLFDDSQARRATTPTTPPPPRIVERLIHTGAITEAGLSRRARPRPCPRCGAWTIAGVDADILALEAHCDPTPLTPLGEALALATGRRTVELIHTRGRYELEQRWADHIAGRPAGAGRRYDVLAEHRHHDPIPTAWSTDTAFTTPTQQEAPTCPPF